MTMERLCCLMACSKAEPAPKGLAPGADHLTLGHVGVGPPRATALATATAPTNYWYTSSLTDVIAISCYFYSLSSLTKSASDRLSKPPTHLVPIPTISEPARKPDKIRLSLCNTKPANLAIDELRSASGSLSLVELQPGRSYCRPSYRIPSSLALSTSLL